MGRAPFLGLLGDALLVGLAGGLVFAVTRFFLPRKGVGEVTDAVVPKPVTAIFPNSGLLFAFGQRPALLIRDDAGEFTAFLATCTHLNCTVTYEPGNRRIVCPCHQGLFDLQGNNVGGPPPRPLPRLEVEIRGDKIRVYRT